MPSGAPQKAKADRNQTNPPDYDVYLPPVKLADLEDQAIYESSGLIASRTSPGSYWTHNDAGNGPLIYAFDSQGRSRGVWQVTGATSHDWEDISAGSGTKTRHQLSLHRRHWRQHEHAFRDSYLSNSRAGHSRRQSRFNSEATQRNRNGRSHPLALSRMAGMIPKRCWCIHKPDAFISWSKRSLPSPASTPRMRRKLREK